MKLPLVYSESKVPIMVWTSDVEPSAQTQLANVANMPGIFHHVAAMPDVHTGYGATVGSVIATKNTIMPSAVGVDIGCGMMAIQLPLKEGHLDGRVAEIRSAIESHIPVGR